MDFKLSESQLMLRETIRSFVAKEIMPIAGKLDKDGEFPWHCIKKLAELGLFGVLLPPSYDGTGPERLGFFIALEEISKASAGLALAVGTSIGLSNTILAAGNEEQKAKYLPSLAKGEKLGATAATEPSGGANFPFTLQSTARLDGEYYVLNGTKCFISNAGEADIYLVLAKTDPGKGPMGISGFIVEKGTPGFSFGKEEQKLGVRAEATRELIFEDCRVPKANLLAKSFLMLMAIEVATTSLPSLGAIAVGVASAALNVAADYIKQRTVTSTKRLADLDVVQYIIADMATKVEASRLLVYQTGCMSEEEPDLNKGLMSSIFPCETALEVTDKAAQIVGGYGYTTDLPLERYLRDARALVTIAQPMELRKLFLGKLMLDVLPIEPPGGTLLGWP